MAQSPIRNRHKSYSVDKLMRYTAYLGGKVVAIVFCSGMNEAKQEIRRQMGVTRLPQFLRIEVG